MTTHTSTATVLICTFDRAALLDETLNSLRSVRTSRSWDVIVVDNNSTDETPLVVERQKSSFPVPLIYLFEPRQGKSRALNTGLAHATGEVIVFTDDDVHVSTAWLDAACEPFDKGERHIAYTGGPVRPLWGAEPPGWFDHAHTGLWGTLALLDYGPESFVFEDRRKVPLGANMAVHRSLIEQIGGFDPELGRKGHSLLGQEQAEFFARARAVDARGCYVPSMVVDHHVPSKRLTKDYFRRWWFWKGVSRARLDAMHQITELGVDLHTVPHIAGIPRYMLGALPRLAWAWLTCAFRGRWKDATRHEMMLCFTAGYARARWSKPSSPPSSVCTAKF